MWRFDVWEASWGASGAHLGGVFGTSGPHLGASLPRFEEVAWIVLGPPEASWRLLGRPGARYLKQNEGKVKLSIVDAIL